MKELLATGATVAALTLLGSNSVGPVYETNCPAPVQAVESEGFVPHRRITMPPVQHTAPDGLLPDFGSQAYL